LQAEQAAMAALEPKSPGRKGKSPAEAELASVRKEKAVLAKDLGCWQQKYEIAMTFVELRQKLLNGEPLPSVEDPPPGEKRNTVGG
jgi:hypothetical protein